MVYQICYSAEYRAQNNKVSWFDYIQLETQAEAEEFVFNHGSDLQPFSTAATGNIQVYAIEYSKDNKPEWALYHDPEALWVWLYCR